MNIQNKVKTNQEPDLTNNSVREMQTIPGQTQEVGVFIPNKSLVYYFLARLGKNSIVEYPIPKDRVKVMNSIIYSNIITRRIINKNHNKYTKYNKFLNELQM